MVIAIRLYTHRSVSMRILRNKVYSIESIDFSFLFKNHKNKECWVE